MALEAVITVTLGLLIVWLVLSVTTNMILDWIGVQIGSSSRDLYRAIASMIQDEDLVRKFYNHPLILSLTTGRRMARSSVPAWFHRYPVLRGFSDPTVIYPNFIPGAIVAEAMFDVFVYESLSTEESREELSLARMQTSIEKLKEDKPKLAQILGKLFPKLDRPSILDVKIAECKKNIENWYNNSTSYLTEGQRRYEETMALIIGFTIALILNVDVISMTLYLWREPTLRQVLVAQANSFQLASPDSTVNPIAPLKSFTEATTTLLRPPIGWQVTNLGNTPCVPFPYPAQSFGIPILNKCLSPAQGNEDTNLLLKLTGFIITALAARQGAPFWSSILKRLTSGVQHSVVE